MSDSHPLLTVATRNLGKIREIRAFLEDTAFRISGLEKISQIGEIPETGKTFAENARIKAKAVHHVTGGYVLADDSGLACDDLKGWPGIYSARFAGPQATDDENNQKLMEEFREIHDPSRRARYVCAMVLIDPAGHEFLVEETCEGVITFVPSGTQGFGYDPYFFLPEKKCTMAELPLDEKNQISHRGKALKKIRELLSGVH